MRRLDLVPWLLAAALALRNCVGAAGPTDATLADGAWWAQWNDPVLAALANTSAW